MAEVSTSPKCMARRVDGKPCNGSPNASGFCLAHDPARAGAIADARRAGGRARHGRRIGTTGDGASVNLATLGDVLGAVRARRQRLPGTRRTLSVGRARWATWLACGATCTSPANSNGGLRRWKRWERHNMTPIITRRTTVIAALEATTMNALIKTTDAILGDLWAAFSDTELLALSSGLGTLPSSRNPWQAAAVDRFEASLQSIQTGRALRAERTSNGRITEQSKTWGPSMGSLAVSTGRPADPAAPEPALSEAKAGFRPSLASGLTPLRGCCFSERG